MSPTNRRSADRPAAYIKCLLASDGHEPLEGCLADLTRDGARIVVRGGAQIDGPVLLLIPSSVLTVRARVCWRRGDEVGVQFEPGQNVRTSPILMQVAELREHMKVVPPLRMPNGPYKKKAAPV